MVEGIGILIVSLSDRGADAPPSFLRTRLRSDEAPQQALILIKHEPTAAASGGAARISVMSAAKQPVTDREFPPIVVACEIKARARERPRRTGEEDGDGQSPEREGSGKAGGV